MKKCINCKYYLDFHNCGVIGRTTKLVKTAQGEHLESPYEEEIKKLYLNETGFSSMLEAIGFDYCGLVADTLVLNKNRNCKYYKRKVWKFWVK
jgi:hypothetical protein